MDSNSDGLFDNPDTEAADTEDADILEILREFDRSAPTIPEEAASGESLVSTPPLEGSMDPDIQPDPENPDSRPLVPMVIDSFPHGSPGAPISQGTFMDDTDREASSSFIWAPFSSQCDWEVAHWAEMRGPTSSAMADLLAIPEV
jgi:hypothetical protein